MQTKRVTFQNRDGVELSGLIDRPDGPARAMALFAHCFTCTKNIKAATNISQALARNGIATMRFDFTGLGQSEGEFADTSFSSNVADIVDAAAFLAADYSSPALLVGHSLGGTAVLQAAAGIDSAVAVATIGSPSTPAHVRHLFADREADIEARGEAEVLLAGRPFTIRKSFLDDLERHPLAETVRGLRRALLIMHSPLDATVEIDNASELFVQALHPKSFITLDRADHLLSDARDSQYAGDVLASWAMRYLPAEAVDDGETATGVEGLVTATTGARGYRTDITAQGHALLADEPASHGGTNTGPSPYGLLAAALASCTTMTLQMYARHKKLPLQEARVTVRHDKIHAEDCEHCETRSGKIDRFDRDIELVGDGLDDAVRQRMLEIADRCPVHRTLEGEVDIRSVLVNAGERGGSPDS